MRVVVGEVGGRVVAAPLARGAGVITSLVRADGLLVIPSGVQGVEAGEKVRVRLYTTSRALNRTIFAIGSHDMSLDLLASSWPNEGSDWSRPTWVVWEADCLATRRSPLGRFSPARP